MINYSLKKFKTHRIIRLFWRRIIFILGLLFASTSTFAQSYFFDNYGVADGLAQSTVFNILQDKNHNIWIGTRAGLSRFDGKSFSNYSIGNGLAANGVKIIFEDNSHRLWLGHAGGGISIYENNQFTIYAQPNEIFNSDITAITTDSTGTLWISSELSGAIRITRPSNSLKTSEFEHFLGSKLSDRIFGAYTLKNGQTIFITDAFLKTYNKNQGKFENYELKKMPRFFQITSMYEDKKGHIWIGTFHGGLYEYNPTNQEFKFYDYIRDGIGSNWITVITEDTRGNIIVGTWGGGLTKIESDRIINFNQTNGLLDNKIRQVFTDAEGNVLIGTNEHGLSIYKGDLFISYFSKESKYNSQIWSVMADHTGKFWFGTNDGITIYNPQIKGEDAFSKFQKQQGEQIRMLKEDSEGRVWIATDNQGIFTYIIKNNIFTYEAKLNSSYIPSLTIKALETDNKGNIWIGTLDGLVCYNIDNKSLNHYTQTTGLAGNEISALYFDKQKRMWIGSTGAGITCYENGEFKKIELKENITPRCFSENSNNEIWVGSEAHGVLVLDATKKELLKTYSEQQGIFANLINLIHCDNQNNVYVGTNKGLNIISTHDNKIYSYSKRNGFTGIETKTNAVFEDKEGSIWFGTIAGAFKFNPKLINHQLSEPLTHIVKMRVNLADRPMTPHLGLRYNENNIIFDYSSICLSNPDAVKYKIFLEGADNDWRVVTETAVTYPALMPNSYTFNVMAQNGEGIWNKSPIQYHFTIRPPFYKTWWFILSCSILGGITVLLYIKIRVKNLKEQNRVLEEKVKERTATVVAQKEELAEKNKDITDSIQYAKRIQFAVLPDEIPFKETFILLKPKDIVSGDFYWIHRHDDLEFIAAVDCTGHGVPGAFMSIIGINMFNKIVKENHIYQPSKILDALNRELLLSLPSQEGEVIQDGMDLALVCYNKSTNELQFAGAFNPLYLIKNGELEEIKADRFSIGRTSLEMENHFTNHTIQMQSGDIMYLFSDGYADQFGGEEGKKFKYKTLKDLLVSIQSTPMVEQKEILNTTIENWKGDLEQIDDILLIGRRF